MIIPSYHHSLALAWPASTSQNKAQTTTGDNHTVQREVVITRSFNTGKIGEYCAEVLLARSSNQSWCIVTIQISASDRSNKQKASVKPFFWSLIDGTHILKLRGPAGRRRWPVGKGASQTRSQKSAHVSGRGGRSSLKKRLDLKVHGYKSSRLSLWASCSYGTTPGHECQHLLRTERHTSSARQQRTANEIRRKFTDVIGIEATASSCPCRTWQRER